MACVDMAVSIIWGLYWGSFKGGFGLIYGRLRTDMIIQLLFLQIGGSFCVDALLVLKALLLWGRN